MSLLSASGGSRICHGGTMVSTQSARLNRGPRAEPRVQLKFGFGYGAETDLAYGFGLVLATAKVHWHKFGFGRNITPKP